MSFQVWIQCHKKDVQKTKGLVNEAEQLDKTQKVQFSKLNGYMLVPTRSYANHEISDGSTQTQTVIELGLETLSTDQIVELIYLPVKHAGRDHSKPKSSIVTDAISAWLEALPAESLLQITSAERADLLSQSPKRWSVYDPMLLLPSGSFQTPPWTFLLETLPAHQQEKLWLDILHAVSKKEGRAQPPLSHLAINSGIPPTQDPTLTQTPAPAPAHENILRRPSGLIMLYGDFGPDPDANPGERSPTEKDFQLAFWVSTKQNGIFQVWAPRYTMFSRGNIKEKARILGFHGHELDRDSGRMAGMRDVNVKEGEEEVVAVDLYAGIGYFAFSYVQLGVGKVVCWEINPWSVEGLRRGMERNGWKYEIFKGEGLETSLGDFLSGDIDRVRVLVLEESNERAVERIEGLSKWEEVDGKEVLGVVRHVNCGFLPSSESSWWTAWRLLNKRVGGWLHLHENVGIDDVEGRRKEVEEKISKWAADERGSSVVEVDHVEYVKTYAPGVWHCVFDVHVRPALAN